LSTTSQVALKFSGLAKLNCNKLNSYLAKSIKTS
jgi:hypothetical protein